MTIPNSSELKVTNLDALPKGLGARYLLCLNAHNGTLIAHSWHHKEPAEKLGYTTIDTEAKATNK